MSHQHNYLLCANSCHILFKWYLQRFSKLTWPFCFARWITGARTSSPSWNYEENRATVCFYSRECLFTECSRNGSRTNRLGRTSYQLRCKQTTSALSGAEDGSRRREVRCVNYSFFIVCLMAKRSRSAQFPTAAALFYCREPLILSRTTPPKLRDVSIRRGRRNYRPRLLYNLP